MILTLPMVAYLKQKFPEAVLVFFGRSYTRAVIEASNCVDEFLNYDDFSAFNRDGQTNFLKQQNADVIIHVFPRKDIAHSARKAGINIRIGTSHRFYHWASCNETVNFSRKKSDLHEAQLNFKLLAPLGIEHIPTLEEIKPLVTMSPKVALPSAISSLLDSEKKKVILHPKSQGSAVEWGLRNFSSLAKLLVDNGFQVIVTGTDKEKELMKESSLFSLDGVCDVTGKLSLEELIALIASCDALVAASTGPLHIASALGKRAVGLYSERKPIHPGRWMPVGENSTYLSKNREGVEDIELDALMLQIAPQEVMALLN